MLFLSILDVWKFYIKHHCCNFITLTWEQNEIHNHNVSLYLKIEKTNKPVSVIKSHLTFVRKFIEKFHLVFIYADGLEHKHSV